MSQTLQAKTNLASAAKKHAQSDVCLTSCWGLHKSRKHHHFRFFFSFLTPLLSSASSLSCGRVPSYSYYLSPSPCPSPPSFLSSLLSLSSAFSFFCRPSLFYVFFCRLCGWPS